MWAMACDGEISRKPGLAIAAMSAQCIKVKALWAAAAAFLVWAGGAFGDPQGQPLSIHDKAGREVGLYQGSYALVVGISTYTNGWPNLPGVEDDVAAVKSELEHHGFDVTLVTNPTYVKLNGAIQHFISEHGRDKRNRLLFYFAGHGYTVKRSWGEEMGYFVPSDAPNPQIDRYGFEEKALAMQRVDEYARRIDSYHALFIFDSCFSGSLFAMSRGVPENISYKTTRPVREFITSGSAGEQVPDKSVFRKEFVEGLQGEADTNHDGFVTGQELGEFLQEKVINYSDGSQHPQYGKIRDPVLDKGDFVFSLSWGEPPVPLPTPLQNVSQLGHLQVNVNVDNSRVYINGVLAGIASRGRPLNRPLLPAGKTQVRVEADGYQPMVREVQVPVNAWGQEMFYLPLAIGPTQYAGGGANAQAAATARIDPLYRQAINALDKGRLTEPGYDNVVIYAREIRQIDPHHPYLERIVREVVARFLDKAKTALGQGQLADAQTLTGNAATVAAEFGFGTGEVADMRRLIAQEAPHLEAQDRQAQARSEAAAEAKRQEAAVSGLLGQADRAIELNRLTLPKDNSAVDFLRRARQLAPQDHRVRDRLTKVADAYLKLAGQDLEQGRAKGAAWFLDKAKAVVDEFGLDAGRVQALAQRIDDELARQTREQEVSDLLAKAEAALKERRVDTPPGEGAVDFLQALLKLAPGESRAREPLIRSLRLYAELGRQALDRGDLEGAARCLERGSGLADAQGLPKDELTSLASALAKARAEQQRDAQVQNLLGRADAALQAGRLDGTGSDNALAYLRQVLTLVPDHPEARSRLAQVLAAYVALGDKALKAGDLAGAEQRLGQAQALVQEMHLSQGPLAQLTWDLAQAKLKHEREGRLAALLAKADAALQAGRLEQPTGASAIDLLRSAYDLAPKDARVQARLGALVEDLSARGGESLGQGDLTTAEERYRQGHELAERYGISSADLEGLKGAIAEAKKRQEAGREAQERKRRVDALLAQAGQAVAAGQWVRPKGRSAADIYRQALALAAGDERVLELLDELVDTIVAKGQEALEANDLAQARAQLQDAQDLARDMRLSTATLDRLAKAIEARATPPQPKPQVTGPEAQIQGLVDKGESALDRWWLTSPAGRSAIDYVRQIFRIAPDHAEGKRLGEAIIAHYLTLARRDLAHSNLDRSGSWLDQAEAVAKELHMEADGLAPLRAQIAAKVKEQEEAAAAQRIARETKQKEEAQRIAREKRRQEQAERAAQAQREQERQWKKAQQEVELAAKARLQAQARQQVRERFARLIVQGEQALGHQQLAQARRHLAEAQQLASEHQLPTGDLERLDSRIKEVEGRTSTTVAPRTEKKVRFFGSF
jgi:Caspase domain/PEGA domain